MLARREVGARRAARNGAAATLMQAAARRHACRGALEARRVAIQQAKTATVVQVRAFEAGPPAASVRLLLAPRALVRVH